MKFVTVTDIASGMLVDLDPQMIFYVRVSEKMGATIVASIAGAYVACREPKDEVIKMWLDARKNNLEMAKSQVESTNKEKANGV